MEQEMYLESTDLSSTSYLFPFVGLYTASGLLLCLVILICDLCHACRRGKLHIPSEAFSLNSLTLSLLGVSMKITLHLTPAVPGIIDQLSKLTGGVLVTILMGFIVPSLADLRGCALLRNMGSMTILVINVIINVIIQIRTGTIFPFYIVEHIVVLVMMLLMLLTMWYVMFIKNWVTGFLDENWRKGTKSIQGPIRSEVLERLSFEKGPQFAVCRYTNFVVSVFLLCIFSLLTLIIAFFRSYLGKSKEFFEGVSDCTWSLWIVVTLQIITVLVAFIAIIFRSCYIIFSNFPAYYESDRGTTNRLVKFSHANFMLNVSDFKEITRASSDKGIDYVPLTFSDRWYIKRLKFLFVVEFWGYFFYVLYLVIGATDYVGKMFACLSKVIFCSRNQSDYMELPKSSMSKSFRDECEDEPKKLIQLFKDTKPYKEFSSLDETSTTCLLAVVLVRLTSIMGPRDESLEKSLAGVFDILQFVEDPSGNDKRKKLAKELWMTRTSRKHWFEKEIITPLRKAFSEGEEDSFMDKFQSEVINNASLNLGIGSGFLFTVIEEYAREVPSPPLKEVIKQLVVDILRSLLPRSLEAITSYVFQSPVAEREERIRTAYKLVYKFEKVSEYCKCVSMLSHSCKYRLLQSDGASSSSPYPSEGNRAAGTGESHEF